MNSKPRLVFFFLVGVRVVCVVSTSLSRADFREKKGGSPGGRGKGGLSQVCSRS